MNAAAEEVLKYLNGIGLKYECVEHAPVRSIEDCAPIGERLNAVVPKNYFLTTRNHRAVYLCLVPPDAHFASSSVSAQANSSRLSFAETDQLTEYLHTQPGAVSPLGLIFDPERKVQLLIDETLRSLPRLAFHPCDNTQMVAMSGVDFFEIFLTSVGHDTIYIKTLSKDDRNILN